MTRLEIIPYLKSSIVLDTSGRKADAGGVLFQYNLGDGEEQQP